MHICTLWITHESILHISSVVCYENMQDNVALWGDRCKTNAEPSIQGFLQDTKIDQENKNRILQPASIHLLYLQKMLHAIGFLCTVFKTSSVQHLAGLHTHTILLYMSQSGPSVSKA